jgi:hypothetical protein
MLFQSLRALCEAPGGAGSIWRYLAALVKATWVSGRFAYTIQTELYFADVRLRQFSGCREYHGCSYRLRQYAWSPAYLYIDYQLLCLGDAVISRPIRHASLVSCKINFRENYMLGRSNCLLIWLYSCFIKSVSAMPCDLQIQSPWDSYVSLLNTI